MPENHHKSSSHVRTSRRGKGERLTKAETQLLQDKFLKAFSMTANVRAACMQTGVDRSTVRHWEENDELFKFSYSEAKDDANDLIRAELQQRAIHGYDKPLISWGGKLVYDENGKVVTEKVKSDTLLSLLAKARLPEFREKQSVDSIQVDNINVLTIDTRSLSPDQLIALKSLAGNMKQEEGGQQ